MRVDELEATLDRLDARGPAPEVHLHDPELPEPGGRDAVAAAPAAPRRGRPASASCSCSRTTPTACCATRATRCRRCYALDGGEFVIYLGTFSKILSPGIRLGWTVAPAPVLEKMNLGKQGADLCSSSFSQMFVATYFARRPLAGLPRRRCATSTAAGATRCSTRSPSTSRARRRGRGRRAGCSSGPRCPTTSTRPTCSPAALSRNVAFVPGRAAYLDGRGAIVDAAELLRRQRRRHPRGRPADRRGRARAGRPLRHAHGQRRRRARRHEAPAPDPDLADVLHLPPRPSPGRRTDAR